MQKYIFLVVALVFSIAAEGQREQGSWQDYLSFANASKVAISSTKVYCVTEGGLFYYDRQDNSINKLSMVNGLSDFGIKTIAYSEEKKVLIVAYNNSNIDLVFDSGIINLPDIKRKQITGDKSVLNISVTGDEAFLACGFGIVVLNLDKREIKDTYFIGEDGTAKKVLDVEVNLGNIYAATENGVYTAAETGINLLDYSNWNKIENIPRSSGKFSHLAVHSGKLIANYTPDEWYQDQMFSLEGENWIPYLPQIKYAHDIQSHGNFLAIASRNDVFVIDNNHQVIGNINYYELNGQNISPIQPRSSVISSDGVIWIADNEQSLVRLSGEEFESISPNGPQENEIFSLHIDGSDLWISPGNKSGWEPPRFQYFNNEKWEYYSTATNPELEGFFNIVKVATDPQNKNHFFVGSWGGGVLEYSDGEFVQRFTNLNSPLETALPQQPNEPYTRIGGLDFDSEGNLWITNSEVGNNLLKYTPAQEWESFSLPELANNYPIGQVLVTRNDDKWILAPRGHDAYVVDKTGAQKRRLLVTSYFNNGQNEIFNRMNDLFSIAEDNEGAIWIGTSKGVAVYNNPQRIWTAEDFYANQPSLDLNDGLYHPLLETETVTAIAVDGANRKWLGTSNSGVYLVSENGEEEIMHFTDQNSPLLSNTINSLAINQLSGEVFIGTDEGLISYQGDAIAGKDAYADVYVYPNPVRETYDGPVTITGLIEQTDIKITDISGNLVYTTTSLGGQAIWNGRNLNGNRVKTGVYLVFCNDEYGEETHITKLLFIN